VPFTQIASPSCPRTCCLFGKLLPLNIYTIYV
jgi:hypothetical protein